MYATMSKGGALNMHSLYLWQGPEDIGRYLWHTPEIQRPRDICRHRKHMPRISADIPGEVPET